MSELQSNRAGRTAGVLAAVLLLPRGAQAHVQIQGLGEFASGGLQPLTTVPDLLLLVGLGLMLGQQRPLSFSTLAWVFAPLSAAALFFPAAAARDFTVPAIIEAALVMAIGAQVALARCRPRWVERVSFALGGLALGLDSSGVSPPGALHLRALMGAWIAVFLIIADVAYYSALWARTPWVLIGVRVAGSWLVAISLLLLAFLVKTKGF